MKVNCSKTVCALGLLGALGCGKQLEFAEVEGRVTLNGKPLPGALVRFYPVSDGKEQLPYAWGLTNPKGKYELTLQDGNSGALVGPNRVVISWPSRDLLEDDTERPPPDVVIPDRYTSVLDTPLTREVKPGDVQIINLELVDQD